MIVLKQLPTVRDIKEKDSEQEQCHVDKTILEVLESLLSKSCKTCFCIESLHIKTNCKLRDSWFMLMNWR